MVKHGVWIKVTFYREVEAEDRAEAHRKALKLVESLLESPEGKHNVDTVQSTIVEDEPQQETDDANSG